MASGQISVTERQSVTANQLLTDQPTNRQLDGPYNDSIPDKIIPQTNNKGDSYFYKQTQINLCMFAVGWDSRDSGRGLGLQL